MVMEGWLVMICTSAAAWQQSNNTNSAKTNTGA